MVICSQTPEIKGNMKTFDITKSALPVRFQQALNHYPQMNFSKVMKTSVFYQNVHLPTSNTCPVLLQIWTSLIGRMRSKVTAGSQKSITKVPNVICHHKMIYVHKNTRLFGNIDDNFCLRYSDTGRQNCCHYLTSICTIESPPPIFNVGNISASRKLCIPYIFNKRCCL